MPFHESLGTPFAVHSTPFWKRIYPLKALVKQHSGVICGYVVMWLCGHAVMWLCSHVVMWPSGYVVIELQIDDDTGHVLRAA